MIEQIKKHTLSLLSSHSSCNRPQVLLGLSGGPDSVLLFYTLTQLHHEKKLFLTALHINHGWRESALRDELFCKALCSRHKIPFSTEHVQDWKHKLTGHKKNSGSLEADARELRRLIFSSYKTQLNASVVALAHHADDQLETFFIRLIRGSGLAGLCGMKQQAHGIIRPLLHTSKKDILAWLTTHNIPFCLDETNESMAFLRNRIRSNLLPAFLQCDERSARNIARTITHLQQENDTLNEICEQTIQLLAAGDGWYKTALFNGYAPSLRARLLVQLSITHHIPIHPSERLFSEVERFLACPRGGIHAVAPEWYIIKKGPLFSLKLK